MTSKATHTPIQGPELIARFLVLEAVVIAATRKFIAMQPVAERDALVSSIRETAREEMIETGHPMTQTHGEAYLEEMIQEISGE